MSEPAVIPAADRRRHEFGVAVSKLDWSNPDLTVIDLAKFKAIIDDDTLSLFGGAIAAMDDDNEFNRVPGVDTVVDALELAKLLESKLTRLSVMLLLLIETGRYNFVKGGLDGLDDVIAVLVAIRPRQVRLNLGQVKLKASDFDRARS